MSDRLDLVDLKEWAQKGFRLKDFYQIFNIPFPCYEEISKSILFLSDLLHNYSWLLDTVQTSNMAKKYRYFNALFSDIFGELAISVKLAGEGYIKYSLREIRSSFDLLFAGIFTVSSWPSDSLNSEEGTNPMADAFISGLWGKMKELNLDDLIIDADIIYFDEGQSAKKNLVELSDELYYKLISKFNFNENKIDEKSKENLKKPLRKLLNKAFIEFIKNDLTLKACEKHEDKLLSDLENKLGIKEELTNDLKQKLQQLTFLVSSDEKGDILCDHCEEEAKIFGIYSRLDTRSMVKLIKYQLKNYNQLNTINSCIKKSLKAFGKKTKGNYFGDIIYSEIYIKLNDYVHSNVVEEPNITEWFYDFFTPTTAILECVLSILI